MKHFILILINKNLFVEKFKNWISDKKSTKPSVPVHTVYQASFTFERVTLHTV